MEEPSSELSAPSAPAEETEVAEAAEAADNVDNDVTLSDQLQAAIELLGERDSQARELHQPPQLQQPQRQWQHRNVCTLNTSLLSSLADFDRLVVCPFALCP